MHFVTCDKGREFFLRRLCVVGLACAGSDGQPQSPSNLFVTEKSTFGRSCTCSFCQHEKSQPPWKIHQKQGKELSPTQPAFCCYYFSWKTEYTTRTMHFTTGAVALWCLSLKTNAFSTNCKRFLDHVLTHPIDPVSRGSISISEMMCF